MNFGRMAKKVFSNEAVENIPVFKHLATNGAEGVGLNTARKVTSQSAKKMNQAGRLDKRIANDIAKNEKKMAGIKSDKGLSDADRTNALSALEARNKTLAGRQSGLTDVADEYQDAMVSGAGDMMKSVGRYFGATDLRGQSGRAMAIGVRGAVGAGAYMGANTALRYVSGGGMTHNNQGERDIAGIPFI